MADPHTLIEPVPADLIARLSRHRCWDAGVQAVFEAEGEPRVDAALQSREELTALCAFLAQQRVRTVLELGTWTGGTARALHDVLDLDWLAVADQGYAETLGLEIELPPGTRSFRGDTESPAYRAWRETLGHVDFVLVDANHAYHAVKRDLLRERALPHRFLCLHDITGATRHTTGVRKLWGELSDGWRHEILRPHGALGLDHSRMGLGIWSAEAPPHPR